MRDNKVRDKLKDVREQLAGARADRTRLRRERDDAREAFGEADFSADGDVKITDTREFRDAERAVKELGGCDDTIAALEEAEQLILHMLGDSSPNGHGRTPRLEPAGHGWDGRSMLASSDAYQAAVQGQLFQSRAKFGSIELGPVATREEAVGFWSGSMAAPPGVAPGADIGTHQFAVPIDQRGVIPPLLKPLTLLDVIPTGVTDSNVVQYVQVTAIPGYAAETAELAVKPEEGITFADATANVVTIAGYAKTARQALDDMSGLATLINTQLPYDVRRRLEAQILSGSGTGINLRGILNTTGIGAPASVAGDTVADAIARAMTTIVLSDANPGFVAMNPLTWLDVVTAKASGSGEYMFADPGGIFTMFGQSTIWGLRITQNRLLGQTAPLVGDPMGATILVREGVNIKTSDSDQDDFIRNRVTVLAETRVAFPVWRPSAFAVAAQG
jgi:HK97 family phage major capsid protein